ncbi:MAG: hypothetical protein AB1589_46355, partial [Cyanobacteriota bacterium]
FDYGWQNGSLNLITPISLDLLSEQYYETKALKWRSVFSLLKDEAVEKKISFDILLTRPTDKSLYKQYDKALKLITGADAPVNAVEESNYEKYLDHAVETIIGNQQ